MLSENSFPSLKKSESNLNDENIIKKPKIMKYSDVLKLNRTKNINNKLKINEELEKETKETRTDLLINSISEKTEILSTDTRKSPIEQSSKPQQENNLNRNHYRSNNNNNSIKVKEESIKEKYEKDIDSIIKIQAWWRIVSKIKSMKNITNSQKDNNKENKKENEKENEEKNNIKSKTLPKKPSFSDIVKLTPPPSPSSTEKSTTNTKKFIKKNKRNNNSNKNNDNNTNTNENTKKNKIEKDNEKKNQAKNKKLNEELNTIFKNMKFMGLIEKEIDDLTEKNTIVNGKQFAKTKVVTIKKFSRNNSTSSSFSIGDDNDKDKDNKKKGNKNENKMNNNKKSLSKKKNVCFNEKDEVFNEYNHVMKKLDLHLRCDKKSCLIDCYRRLYKREWEDDEESSSNSGNSEGEETNNTDTAITKKPDYLYSNDIYNPNYTKYYSGSEFDFGNRYFTGKERLKKALHLEPVEVTVQKIIYQPMKFHKQGKRNNQQKKKNVNNKRKQNK